VFVKDEEVVIEGKLNISFEFCKKQC